MTNEEIRAQVHRIVDIVLDGNGFESRRREETGSLPTLFMNYSGHVNTIYVDLHSDGWEAYQERDRQWEFRLDRPITIEEIESMADAIRVAYEAKTETELLRRDILRQEGKLKDEKDKLALLKKTLKRKERKEKADAVDAGHNED